MLSVQYFEELERQSWTKQSKEDHKVFFKGAGVGNIVVQGMEVTVVPKPIFYINQDGSTRNFEDYEEFAQYDRILYGNE